MIIQESVVHSSLSARGASGKGIQAIKIKSNAFDEKHYRALPKLGVHVSDNRLRQMVQGLGMDDLQPLVTTPSITVPVQFLQMWAPGFVHVITAARRIDDLVGLKVMGNWADEQIVQGVLERAGNAIPYGDYQNVPFSSWNTNWEFRTVIRFEEGMRVGMLEEARSARANVASAAEKRGAAAQALEIQRNLIGFFGYNNGANNTFGFFNDPGLPSYIPVVEGASTETFWSTKTMTEICNDIRTAVETLRTQSLDQIDPERLDLTLALPTDAVDFLTTISDFGYSVRKWMSDTYPRMRVVSAPELDLVNGGENVFYLYADKVSDASTDGGDTWAQFVPSKFMVLGVARYAKYYEEDYLNATAGLMLKRPYAVVRFTGI